MNRKQRINKLLSQEFKDFSIDVIDNSDLHAGHGNFDGKRETHIQVILQIKKNKAINRLNIHKKINSLLSDEFKYGLHSLEIKIN